MTMTPQRTLLFLAGLLIAGLGAAYYGGAFDRQAAEDVAQVRPSESAAADEESASDTGGQAPAEEPVGESAAAANSGVVVPTFDLLRVDPDGSLVIAGRADPNSSVEIVAGSSVLATAKAGTNGDFASVLDRALKPGEHTVVLRSTSSEKVSATSLETAIVSIPSNRQGEVVALVQQPGQPSRLISVPEDEPGQHADGNDLAANEADADEEGQPDSAATGQKTAATEEAAPESRSSPEQRGGTVPFIEAVEIDGREVFVVGQAEPGKRVRVYVNDVLLGQAIVDAEGRFLIQTERNLPVGDYIVRADVLARDGQTVITRAAVPFVRQPGESMTSIAPGAVQGASAGESDRKGDAVSAAVHDTQTMTAPALQREDGAVIIRKGDTLWNISRRVYGRGMRYTTIYQANKDQIRDPNRIWPGQTFSLPASSNEGEAADLSVMERSVSPLKASGAGGN